MSQIKTTDVSVRFGQKEIVQAASLEIRSGEVVGLIGPNGAGKSTLMRAIAGLLDCSHGRIEIAGKSANEISSREKARQVAYLPQARDVHWPLSVERIVTLGRLPYLQPWQEPSDEDEKIVMQVMASTDIIELRNRPVDQLAGGEKALVMLARALAVDAPILLVDEPVAGLDPNHQLQVMQLLKQHAAQGKSVLVVLHDLTLAARFCDRIYLMNQGKIAASGEPKDVLSEDNLKATYGIEALFGCEEDGFYVVPWKRI